VVTGSLAAVGIAITLFTGAVGHAGTRAEQVPVSYVTVAPGETLWAIANEVAPDDDPRDTVQRILDLNALESSGVQAGQRIAVPVQR
jgi:LysM repeat protein